MHIKFHMAQLINTIMEMASNSSLSSLILSEDIISILEDQNFTMKVLEWY